MTEPAITLKALSRKFGRKWAVHDLSLDIPKGSVFGLLGPNGAGKSTTINMLMGLLPPTYGTSSVLGLDSVKQGVALRKRVGFVPEKDGFYDWMRIDNLVALVAAYHDSWNWKLCQTMLQEFGLDNDAQVDSLSKGMRAKLSLLIALSPEPEMLVLDEPTGGLDPAARRNFIETILGRFQEEGKTILVSSHLLNEFSGLIDHIAFIRDGELELATSLDELHLRTKRVRLTFEEGVPTNLTLPSTISLKTNGRDAVATCNQFDPDTTLEALKQTGATNIAVEEMTLEDIFVDLVGS